MMEQAALDGVSSWKNAVESASSWMSVDEEDGESNVDEAIVEEAEDEDDNDIELIVQVLLWYYSEHRLQSVLSP